MMYHIFDAWADWLDPPRAHARAMAQYLGTPGISTSGNQALRSLAATMKVFGHAQLTHSRPQFGIGEVEVAGHACPVREEVALRLPFGNLLHFAKDGCANQPRVLLVAPMSGHFATLLRETVRTMLADHDVFITDWANGRNVALSEGRFGLDEYIDYLIKFLEAIGPGAHLVAICQPCVAALAAAAVMCEDGNASQPASLTLMAGPIDARINPTDVNRLAMSKPIEWFEKELIQVVPWRHQGAGRRVYPGFIQLSAFLSMNVERHMRAFNEMHDLIVDGQTEQAQVISDFYDEYFAVADLPAEFYLETVSKVFQTFDLARNQLTWHGRAVTPRSIRRSTLLTIEGERDDICAIGQTVAAHDLCSSIRPYKKAHHVQTGVGHYGVFSGRRWNTQVYPRVRDIIHMAS
jgi:poly(3-hydroxybutyrate) depolymerase